MMGSKYFSFTCPLDELEWTAIAYPNIDFSNANQFENLHSSEISFTWGHKISPEKNSEVFKWHRDTGNFS